MPQRMMSVSFKRFSRRNALRHRLLVRVGGFVTDSNPSEGNLQTCSFFNCLMSLNVWKASIRICSCRFYQENCVRNHRTKRLRWKEKELSSQLTCFYWLNWVNLYSAMAFSRSRYEIARKNPKQWFHNDFRRVNLFLRIPGSWEPVYKAMFQISSTVSSFF